jgi:predicted nucleic acid-binding protein
LRLYLDTSALVKLYVEEEGSSFIRQAVADAETVATSAIAYVEARAAFTCRRREKRFSSVQYGRLIQDLDLDWDSYVLVEVSAAVIRAAATLTERHPLRAYDAVHLASARLLAESLAPERFLFASWDDDLERAAKKEGVDLVRR